MKHDWRGTWCPITPTRTTIVVVTAKIFTLFKANIQRWRPLAATTKEVARPHGRATSFIVSFVSALNRVNVVAMTTILVLHVVVIGHHVPCYYDCLLYTSDAADE